MGSEARGIARAKQSLPWPVVHGAAAVNFVVFGSAYAMAVFFPFLRADMGVQPWQLTALFSISGGVYFAVGTLSGTLTDHFGARPVVRAGMLFLAGGLLLAGQSNDPLYFSILYVVGIGLGVGLSYVPSLAAVQVHSGRHAALAGGLATSGIGVGTMVVPPACAWMLEHASWRVAISVLALLAVLGFVASRPLIRVGPPEGQARRRTVSVWSPQFTMLYIAYLCIGLIAFVPMANVVPFIASKGLPDGEAAIMLALVGSGSILGRIGFGMMAEYTGARRASVQCAVLLALSFTWLAMKEELVLLHVATLLFGLGYGGITGLTAPTAAEVMGLRHFGGMLGTLMTSRAVGVVLGPSFTALMGLLGGSFVTPYLICGILAAVAAGLLHAEKRLMPVPVEVERGG